MGRLYSSYNEAKSEADLRSSETGKEHTVEETIVESDVYSSDPDDTFYSVEEK